MIPEVSIILTCYNYGKYISECLVSVQKQTFKNWECIVVDDGSTDDTSLNVNQFLSDQRIKYFFIKNSGVANARNTGIGFSKSNYLVPLDADDILGVTFIEDLLNYHKQDSDLTLAYPRVNLFGEQNGEWNLPEYSYQTLLVDNLIVATSMFKKNDFNRIGGYDTLMTSSEDWDFWLRLLYGNKRAKQSENLIFNYRIKAKSRNTSVLLERNKRFEVYRYISKKNKDIYSECFESPLVLFHKLTESLSREQFNFEKRNCFYKIKVLKKIKSWVTSLK